MALATPTLKVTGNVSGNITSVSTTSWTPVAGRLYIVYVSSYDTTGSPSIPTLAGNGITWIQAATDSQTDAPSNGMRETAFYAIAPGSPTTGATTATWGDTQSNGAAISIEEWSSGFDTVNPIGNVDARSGAGVTSLSATGLTYNRASSGVSVGVMHNGSSGGYTAGASMTLLGSSILGGNCSMHREYALTNVATPSMSWVNSGEAVIIALEVQQPAAASDSGTDGAKVTDSATVITAQRPSATDGAKLTESCTVVKSGGTVHNDNAPDAGKLQEDAHPDIEFSFPDEGAKASDSATVTVTTEQAPLFASDEIYFSDEASANVTIPSLPPTPGLDTREEVVNYTLLVVNQILAEDQTNSHVIRQLHDFRDILQGIQ